MCVCVCVCVEVIFISLFFILLLSHGVTDFIMLGILRIYMYQPSLLHHVGFDSGSVFKRIFTGLKSEYSFS